MNGKNSKVCRSLAKTGREYRVLKRRKGVDRSALRAGRIRRLDQEAVNRGLVDAGFEGEKVLELLRVWERDRSGFVKPVHFVNTAKYLRALGRSKEMDTFLEPLEGVVSAAGASMISHVAEHGLTKDESEALSRAIDEGTPGG